jgi:hypothetical protein
VTALFELIGHVDSEGGPLLIADAELAKQWRGIAGNGPDYDRACAALGDAKRAPAGFVSIQSGAALVWDLGGEGTASVFCTGENELLIVRSWINDPLDENAVVSLAKYPANTIASIGELRVSSTSLVIAWATEDLGESLEASGKMWDTGNALLIRASDGIWNAEHEEVSDLHGQSARRLRLSRGLPNP